MQPAAEAHIVAAVGLHEAPAEWGCDAVWHGGDVEYEKCVAVYAVGYTIDESATSPFYLDDLLGAAPSVVGEKVPFPAPVLDMSRLLPADKSYFTYVGSLVRFCDPLLQPFVSSTAVHALRDLKHYMHSFMQCEWLADHSTLHGGAAVARVQRPCPHQPANGSSVRKPARQCN